MDEFGPLNLQPHPGRQWAERGGKHKDPDREPRPRRRATYTRTHGVRHLFAAYDLGKDQLYGHIKKTKNRSKFLEFCRYLRSLHPVGKRIAIVCDGCDVVQRPRRDVFQRPQLMGLAGALRGGDGAKWPRPGSCGETVPVVSGRGGAVDVFVQARAVRPDPAGQLAAADVDPGSVEEVRRSPSARTRGSVLAGAHPAPPAGADVASDGAVQEDGRRLAAG